MPSYEKIRPNFYGLEIYSGKMELKPTHSFSSFFIVEKEHGKEFIKKQARQLLLAGSDYYLIYDDYKTYKRVLSILKNMQFYTKI